MEVFLETDGNRKHRIFFRPNPMMNRSAISGKSPYCDYIELAVRLKRHLNSNRM